MPHGSSALGRYASKDLFEKGYDSLGSGCGSLDRLQTEGNVKKQSTK